MAVNNAESRVSLFTLFVCDFCVVWVIQNELLEWFISPCELIFGVIVVN